MLTRTPVARVGPLSENRTFSTVMLVVTVKFGLSNTAGVKYARADETPVCKNVFNDVIIKIAESLTFSFAVNRTSQVGHTNPVVFSVGVSAAGSAVSDFYGGE